MSENLLLGMLGFASACVVALAPTLVAYAGLKQSRENADKAEKAAATADAKADEVLVVTKSAEAKAEVVAKEADAKVNILTEKAVEIHTVSNSNFSELRKDYELVLEQLRGANALLAARDKAEAKAEAKEIS